VKTGLQSKKKCAESGLPEIIPEMVPYIEDDEKIFLKTIIPNSKATKKYLGDKKE
jgi:hypothetical protein